MAFLNPVGWAPANCSKFDTANECKFAAAVFANIGGLDSDVMLATWATNNGTRTGRRVASILKEAYEDREAKQGKKF